MKKITKTIIALSVLAGLASCAKEQTPVTPEVNDGMMELTLTAEQENSETRAEAGKTTTADGKTTTPILWTTGDCLSVLDGTNNNKFTLAAGAGTATGAFSGSVSESATNLFVFYPYSKDVSLFENAYLLGITLKSDQTATAGSFDPAAALMAAKTTATSTSVSLKNLVGYVKVTPQFDCKKISLVSNSASDALSGTIYAGFESDGTPVEEATSPSSRVSISGDIKAGSAYYIAVLPVKLKSGFKLVFTMSDGTEKYRESSSANILNIEYSKVKNLGEIQDSALTKDEGLSAYGTANCYFIHEAGTYKFKTVKGNSTESVGTVASAEVLWESFGTDTAPTKGEIISSVSYSDNYIEFSTPADFKQGNAVIAAKDASGTILWSWHIWCASESWKEQVYFNDAGTMMDRNLGATTATAGEVGSRGLLYQWGRKDPFLGSSSVSGSTQALSTGGTWTISSDSIYEDEAIKNPMTFYKGTSRYVSNNSWNSGKTIYDPCPAGWRVPDGGRGEEEGQAAGIWYKAVGGTISSTPAANGFNFGTVFGSDATIWYPVAGYLDGEDGALKNVGNTGSFWSATRYGSTSAYILYIESVGGEVNLGPVRKRVYGASVRCQKL